MNCFCKDVSVNDIIPAENRYLHTYILILTGRSYSFKMVNIFDVSDIKGPATI